MCQSSQPTPRGLCSARVEGCVKVMSPLREGYPMGISLPYSYLDPRSHGLTTYWKDPVLGKVEGLGIGWENNHSSQHSLLFSPTTTMISHMPYLYSWLITSKEEMSTFMNYPINVLQCANPSVILSNFPAKVIISHHGCLVLKITLEIIFFILHVHLYIVNLLSTYKVWFCNGHWLTRINAVPGR